MEIKEKLDQKKKIDSGYAVLEESNVGGRVNNKVVRNIKDLN